MVGFVSLVGAGPWDPELLTLAGRDRLARAQCVIADYLVNPALLVHCPSDCEVHQRTTGPSGRVELEQAATNALMLERARAGLRVVRLKGGDPCMFGRGGEEAQVLVRAGIAFELVPGVSAPIAAPQYAGIAVTHRDHTPAVTFVSGWEAYDKAGLAVQWEHLARSAGTIVLLMGVRNARDNAARLVAAGRDASTPTAAIRWGTRGIQRTVVATLGTIADAIEREGLRAPAVLVIGDVVDLRHEIAWFEQRPLFGKRVVVTKSAPGSLTLASALGRAGADVAIVPCLATVPPSDPAAFDHASEFDAVVVSTCEHTHAIATMLALKHKKHVYCEKPLTHNVYEARKIREAAAAAGVVTQMGIQMHATENYRRVVELVQGGAIGPVHEAHVWVSRAWGLQSKEASDANKDRVFVTERPPGMPVPAGLNWDLWLGPAPARPFNEVYVPGPKWYRWWDFGNGTMSDLGSHWNDSPVLGAAVESPAHRRGVRAEGASGDCTRHHARRL